MNSDDDSKNPKSDKIQVVESPTGTIIEETDQVVNTLSEKSVAMIIAAAHEIIDGADTVISEVEGDDQDFIELLSMSVGLAAGRLGFSRGGMIEMVLNWYDQGMDEREEHESEDPEIEVTLEGSGTQKAN